MAEIINGKVLASKIKQEVKQEINELGISPYFVIVQIGDNPASNTYVRNKIKDCKECGIDSYLRHYNSLITQDCLENFFKNMSADKGVNALMLQLPIPKHLDAQKIINKIAPRKDADGLTTINNGLLATGQNGFIPCIATQVFQTEGFNKTDFKDVELPEKSYLPPEYQKWVKDYILRPKETGYQSLHVVFQDPSTGRCFEIQIRTFKMHIHAESHSLAGHDAYKKQRYAETNIEFDRSRINIDGYAYVENQLFDFIGLEKPYKIIERGRPF